MACTLLCRPKSKDLNIHLILDLEHSNGLKEDNSKDDGDNVFHREEPQACNAALDGAVVCNFHNCLILAPKPTNKYGTGKAAERKGYIGTEVIEEVEYAFAKDFYVSPHTKA